MGKVLAEQAISLEFRSQNPHKSHWRQQSSVASHTVVAEIDSTWIADEPY